MSVLARREVINPIKRSATKLCQVFNQMLDAISIRAKMRGVVSRHRKLKDTTNKNFLFDPRSRLCNAIKSSLQISMLKLNCT
jgi:hypothetical protein